jgi:hypothetical protein
MQYDSNFLKEHLYYLLALLTVSKQTKGTHDKSIGTRPFYFT